MSLYIWSLQAQKGKQSKGADDDKAELESIILCGEGDSSSKANFARHTQYAKTDEACSDTLDREIFVEGS